MALVAYSDSESSGDETPPTKKPTTTNKASTTKPGFQKFADSSNPHKIKVSLPSAVTTRDADVEDGEPAAKRAKNSGGGFNSMLPAPKRPKAALANNARGKGLGSGINLKTGAAPGFSREAVTESTRDENEMEFEDSFLGDSKPTLFDNALPDEPAQEQPKKGNAMAFKPLSVSRKPKKKSAASVLAAQTRPTGITSTSDPTPPKPKVSLFSAPVADDLPSTQVSNGHYQPLIHKPDQPEDAEEDYREPPEPSFVEQSTLNNQNTAQQPESLTSIANSLNLSASQKRQLMGRRGADYSAARVVEFNTSTEYDANEELRAKGDTIKFNPVRSVTSGKANLQQLVNLVSNQKEALEESFAAGRRNKKEAGAKYGW